MNNQRADDVVLSRAEAHAVLEALRFDRIKMLLMNIKIAPISSAFNCETELEDNARAIKLLEARKEK